MMPKADKPANEKERLSSLKELNILDTPIQDSFDRITRLVKATFHVPIVAISLLDDERQWFKSTQGIDICQTNRDVSFCAHAILQDDIFIVPDATKDSRFSDNPLVINPPKIRFYAGYPIHSKQGYKIGALCIIDQKPRTLSKEELVPLKDMAALVESELLRQKQSMVQKNLIAELDAAKRARLIDSLTRLWNRGGTDDLLHRQILIARQQAKGFGLAMIDIDNFKSVNDQQGHLVGDQVLRAVTERLLTGFRDTDILGRWGGEEFLAIINLDNSTLLPNCIERARLKVSEKPIENGGKKLSVSVTIGATYYDGKTNIELNALVAQADKALYQGKSNGKNKTVVLPL